MAGQVTRHHPALAALHWVLAFLIIADLTIGTVVLVHIPNDAPKKLEGLRAHMSGGLAILALMSLRLGVRLGSAKPADAPTGSALLDRIAWLSHRMLYGVVFGMIASGVGMALQSHAAQAVFLHQGKLPASFWIYPLRSVHFVLAKVLMTLIGLHVAGALYHTFVRRDRLLARMWFGQRRPTDSISVPARTRAPMAWATWVSRVILGAPALLFASIAFKYLSSPLEVAAQSGMVLATASAVTDLRVEGGLFAALAAALVYCLVAERRRLAGLGLLAAVIVPVTAARILGLIADGAASETIVKLRPELLLTVLAIGGLALELHRRRRLDGADRTPATPWRPRGARTAGQAGPG